MLTLKINIMITKIQTIEDVKQFAKQLTAED